MRKMIAKLFILGFVCCLFTGCVDNPPEPVALDCPYNVSLITVIANNNPVLDTGIDELARLADVAGTTYSCILADSTPSVICDGTVPDFENKAYSEDMIKRARAAVSADIISKLNDAAPDSNEIDIAAAASLAVRMLRSNEAEGRENLLVFYGSGISTSGVIDLTTVPVSELDVSSSVTSIAELMDMDLSGIKIIWYCCGDVAGTEQAPLSDNEKNTLKEFYRDLFMELGALEVEFMDDVPIDGCYNFDHHVSVMQTEGTISGLKAKVIDYDDIAEEKAGKALEEAFAEGDIIAFDEKSIAFMPDSTELADRDVALESLDYVISYMEKYQDFKVMVCGTTTSAGDQNSCISFSEKRADAVRVLLMEAGISEDRVVVLGCGWSSCLYIDDRDADGNLDEHASQNRSVKLVDYGSTTAQEIIDSLAQ